MRINRNETMRRRQPKENKFEEYANPVLQRTARYQHHLLLKLEMNTTSTAQYAALAANNSCLFAFVKRLIAAENSSVKTTRIPTASNVELRFPTEVSLYMATTGKTRRMKMIIVMMRPTSFSMRDCE
jgi:hypothetical protein